MSAPALTARPPAGQLSREQLLELYHYMKLNRMVEDRLGKNRNYGLGPEASMVLPLKMDLSKLALFNFRYLFDLGTKLDTKGQTLVFNVTFKLK